MVVVCAMMVGRQPGLLSHSGAQVAEASKASGTNLVGQVTSPETEEEESIGASTMDDYDMLANFDVLSELTEPGAKVVD
jgi:hypothetical protein